MGKLFLSIRSTKEHNFIMDTQYKIFFTLFHASLTYHLHQSHLTHLRSFYQAPSYPFLWCSKTEIFTKKTLFFFFQQNPRKFIFTCLAQLTIGNNCYCCCCCSLSRSEKPPFNSTRVCNGFKVPQQQQPRDLFSSIIIYSNFNWVFLYFILP
jgi:hypothetical protein